MNAKGYLVPMVIDADGKGEETLVSRSAVPGSGGGLVDVQVNTETFAFKRDADMVELS